MVDALDDGRAHLNNLDVTWGLDIDEFLQERAQQAPAAGEVGDGTAETMGPSQGGAVDASSVPRRRAETAETMGSLKAVRWTSSGPSREGQRKPGRSISL